jgi:hypothetical protein
MEKMPTYEDEPFFVFPTFRDELGEIERVQQYFNIDSPDFVASFLERATHNVLIPLSDELWSTLENTDSTDIQKDDWASVADHSEAQEKKRDWQDLRTKLEAKIPLDAPVIAKYRDTFHLVSGNTRLMVSRALGIRPQVLIVDISNS